MIFGIPIFNIFGKNPILRKTMFGKTPIYFGKTPYIWKKPILRKNNPISSFSWLFFHIFSLRGCGW